MKKLRIVGIDIAKQVFHLVGMDEHGTILVRKRLYRAQVMAFIAQLPPRRSLVWKPAVAPMTGRAAFASTAMRSSSWRRSL